MLFPRLSFITLCFHHQFDFPLAFVFPSSSHTFFLLFHPCVINLFSIQNLFPFIPTSLFILFPETFFYSFWSIYLVLFVSFPAIWHEMLISYQKTLTHQSLKFYIIKFFESLIMIWGWIEDEWDAFVEIDRFICDVVWCGRG